MTEPKRRQRRRVDGVLLLDKPAGMTSNTALQKARGLFNAAKAGHTGTLDPLATGLLPLCFGEATKFSGMLLEADKTYEATVRLGIVTTTADAEGEVVAVQPVTVGEAQVREILARFVGVIEQVPPMYSALKHGGKPLYELARQGIEIERSARRVTIHALELLAWRADGFDLRVTCSKGTYVRTLAADIGAALGCGGHLAALRRTRVGALTLDGAVTLDRLAALAEPAREECLLPPDALLHGMPLARLQPLEAARIGQGQAIRWHGEVGQLWRLVGPDGFLGVGELVADGWLKPKRLIASG